MKQFPDSAGRTWTIALTIDAVKRVRGLLSVDLLDLAAGEPPLLTRLSLDVVLLCDVLYALCEPQAKAANVSDEDFGRAMGGDSLLLGQQALLQELADFFQSLGRTEQTRMIEAQRKLILAAVARVEQRLQALNIDQLVASIVGGSFPSVPGSSASTPARSV